MLYKLLISAAFIPSAVLAAGHLKLDFNVEKGQTKVDVLKRSLAASSDDLVKRDPLSVDLTNYNKTEYVLDLLMGSEKQKVTFKIDTRTSDLWVLPSDGTCSVDSDDSDSASASAVASEPASTCSGIGSFNTGKSSSFEANGPQNSRIVFRQNRAVFGSWGSDNVVIGDVVIKNASLVVADDSGAYYGTLGVGLKEQAYGAIIYQFPFQYETFPFLMKTQGIIDKAAYSLYLNEDANLGAILFGGVDHAKYSGDLVTLPILRTMRGLTNCATQANYSYSSVQIALDSITIANGATNIDLTLNEYPAIIDLSSAISSLPADVFSNLVTILSGNYDSDKEAYVVDCGLANNLSMMLSFGGQQISVPMSEVIQNVDDNTCVLSVLESEEISPAVVIGHNFLRHMYVVIDLEDHQVSVAASSYSADEEIETISSAIPGAIKAVNFEVAICLAQREASVTQVATTNSAASSAITANTKATNKGSAAATASVSSTRSKAGAVSMKHTSTGGLILMICAAFLLLL